MPPIAIAAFPHLTGPEFRELCSEFLETQESLAAAGYRYTVGEWAIKEVGAVFVSATDTQKSGYVLILGG